jgi:DNA-binding MarR family transcriptional regulator
MANPQENVVDFPAQAKSGVDRSFVARWKHEELFDQGFVAIPTRFLQLYANLKPHPLTPGEAIFVMQLMSFKWTADAPFPGYKRIAKRMGLTDKMVRKYAQSLEAKGYVKREKRVSLTNRFDLTGLFDALRAAAEHAKVAEQREAAERLQSSIAEIEHLFREVGGDA